MKEVKFNTAGKTAAQVIGFIQLAIGDDMPHKAFCGNAVESRTALINATIISKFIFVDEEGMISVCNSSNFFENHKYNEVDHLGNEVKPRTKTEYVKIHKSNTTPSEFCQMILDGIKFYDGEHCGGHYDDINAINRYGRGSQSLYRKVEKEIDWREDFESFFNTTDYLSRNDKLCSVYNGDTAEDDEKWDSEFIAMCRLVESLTRHIEVE